MDSLSIKPIFIARHIETREHDLLFLVEDNKTIIKSEKEKNAIRRLLLRCDGQLTLKEIVMTLKRYPESYIVDLINELINLKIVLDADELALYTHFFGNYPGNSKKFLSRRQTESHQKERSLIKTGEIKQSCIDKDSYVFKIISNRRSCRAFSNKTLTIEMISNICRSGYDIKNHAVPSGGALYPLKIYVIVSKGAKGYYEYDPYANQLVCFSREVNTENLKYCFNSSNKLPFGSNVQIIICANFKRSIYKYSNRGYRLVLLEAGHVAQNINLYCAEKEIATCELGGLLDDQISEELLLEKIYIQY